MVVLLIILALYSLAITGILLAVLAGANKSLADKNMPGKGREAKNDAESRI